MNDVRRKAIGEAADLIRQGFERLRELADEEQEAFDNLPESLQSAEQGEKMGEAIDALNTAADDAENAIDNLGDL